MPEPQKQINPAIHFTRGLFFLIFSTVGLAAIALACLASPITQYYNDQKSLTNEKLQIEKLEKFSVQQNDLLQNIKNQDPSVIERIAIYTLKYQRANSLTDSSNDTTAIPIASAKTDTKPKPIVIEVFANIINENLNYQRALIFMGTILTAISMTCFNHKTLPEPKQ